MRKLRAVDYPPHTKEENEMPGFNRTGPRGMGPMTGGRRGICAGYRAPAYPTAASWPAYHGGRGGFGGRGWRHWYHSTGMPGWARAGQGLPAWGGYAAPVSPWPVPAITKDQELEQLKHQAEYFEDALTGVKKRLEELETASPES